tara:strand:- start:884 stop:1414 length:531 start_codon:yes stop_codon:yes gene_type:complete
MEKKEIQNEQINQGDTMKNEQTNQGDTMNKINRKHIGDKEYSKVMNQYHRGQLTDEEIMELEQDIKTWELFRVSSLVGMGESDMDGLPTPLLRLEMKKLQRWDFNGGEKKNYISCFSVNQFSKEDDNISTSETTRNEDGYETIGEYYRTLQYQYMMWSVWFPSYSLETQLEESEVV